jgi:hypothetical protein
LTIGCRRSQKALLGAEILEKTAMPSAASSMANQAGNHDLMHGEYHRSRGATAAQYITDIDDIRDGGALASEFARDQNAEQSLSFYCSNRLVGKPCVAVDRDRVGCGRRGSGLPPGLKVIRHWTGLYRHNRSIHIIALLPRQSDGNTFIIPEGSIYSKK